MSLSRREFIKSMGAAGSVGVASFFSSWPTKLFAADKTLIQARKNEVLLLEKLVDIIIPKTEGTPAASEVQVAAYIQKVMGGEIPRYRLLRRSNFYRKAYEKLFTRIEKLSQEKYQKKFLELKTEDATTLLSEMAKDSTVQVGYRTSGLGKVEVLTDAQLFSMLRTHSLQGYFADPSYRGNADYKSWEAIGYTCQMNYPGDQGTCAAEDKVHNHD